MTTFHIETFQNEHLPVGGTEIDAIVTVTCDGTAEVVTGTPPLGTAVVIILDVSGSMTMPRTKIRAARKAALAAIAALRDGTVFAVIKGSDTAQQVYPAAGMVPATAASRRAAKSAVRFLATGGGTAISSWLLLARSVLEPYDGWIRQAILLTDGRNQDEQRLITWALQQCAGVFRCDSRGVGTDWSVDDLRRISDALLGTVDIVADPTALVGDFEAIVNRTMRQHSTDVRLRLALAPGGTVRFVKQVAPTIADLTERGVTITERTTDYPLGAWENEERDYHVRLTVRPQDVNDQLLAARASVESSDEGVATAQIRATWTDDPATSTMINQRVAHYTGQQELVAAVASGLAARSAGDEATASAQLGRAVQLASASGHDATLELLRRVVDVEDAASGTIRLKPRVEVADEMALDTRSTKTVRIRPAG